MGLDDDLMYVMRPVLAHLCNYESLLDGTLDLADIALLNAALSVDIENTYRIQEAAKHERDR